jgi:hypothetical protein
MAIVAGFDVHRAQITFDVLNQETGEVECGRIRATPEAVREWAERFGGEELHVAVEACTGWLFVCEALSEAGATPRLAEPTEVSALRGPKRRAKTDRADARWLRTLLAERRLPEAWIPPAHVREWRTRTRLRKTLVDERTSWLQRIQATLFHHGVSGVPDKLLSARGRAFLAGLELAAAAHSGSRSRSRWSRRSTASSPRSSKSCASWRAASRVAERSRPTSDRRADSTHDPLRARRRQPAVGRTQGGALLRSRHRRPPLRSPLTSGQADAARRAWAALGTLRGGPGRLPALEPRPRGLSRAQGARALTHQSVADDRPQARPPLLPHPPGARARGARARQLTPVHPLRQAHQLTDDKQSSGQLPQLLRHPPEDGGPPKTERPESFPADRPIEHHVAGHKAEHPDKAGRPRSDRTSRRTSPQPLTAALDRGPDSDKQQSRRRYRLPCLATVAAEPRCRGREAFAAGSTTERRARG